MEYTSDYFRATKDNYDVRDAGANLVNGVWDVNMSDIITRLIQLAGRYCDRYASDLFIHWNDSRANPLDKDFRYGGGKMIFGFRESGVDVDDTVVKNYNNNPYYYRKISIVETIVECDGDLMSQTIPENIKLSSFLKEY